ncbi:response regulator [Patescibacteria group bacterium]|nr:response regulator [Patescibacteria group bacterium]
MATSKTLSKGKKILIIEDEIAFVKSLDSVLSKKYVIVSAENGKEGFKKAKKLKPDLIMLDMILPDCNGIEVIRKLKNDKTTRDIKVVVLTSLGDADNISKVIQVGCQDYIVKADFSLNEILNKIDEILA